MLQTTPSLTLVAYKSHVAETAKALIAYSGCCKIWVLRGALGSGKTTLIRALCNEMGVKDHVTSPTFSLINEYTLPTGELMVHIDAYRLADSREIVELDYSFYLDMSSYCFIEWPKNIIPLLQSTYLEIQIEPLATDVRKVVATMVSNAIMDNFSCPRI